MGFEMPPDMTIWIGLGILFGIIEVFTTGFFFLFFFSVGALLTALFCLATDSVLAQVVVFVLISVTSVIFARPVLKNSFQVGDHPQPSNVSALIGAEVLVLEDVDKYKGKVKVTHTGEVWTAFMSPPHDVETLTSGSPAIIDKIDGAKLGIRPKTS